MTAEPITFYEVYNRRTGQPITAKISGRPVRSSSMSGAARFVNATLDPDDPLHVAIHERDNIPDGAELDVRPVSVLIYHKDLTLSDALDALGYTCEDYPNSLGRRRILRDGTVRRVGNCREVWAWLRDTGQLTNGDTPCPAEVPS